MFTENFNSFIMKKIAFSLICILLTINVFAQSKAEYQQQVAQLTEQLNMLKKTDSINMALVQNTTKMLNDNYQTLHRADSLALAQQQSANKILEDKLAQQASTISSYSDEVKRLTAEVNRLQSLVSGSTGTPYWEEFKGQSTVFTVPAGKMWVIKGYDVCQELQDKYETDRRIDEDTRISTKLDYARLITIPNTTISTDMSGIATNGYFFPEGTKFEFKIIYTEVKEHWNGSSWVTTKTVKATPSDAKGFLQYVEMDMVK